MVQGKAWQRSLATDHLQEKKQGENKHIEAEYLDSITLLMTVFWSEI